VGAVTANPKQQDACFPYLADKPTLLLNQSCYQYFVGQAVLPAIGQSCPIRSQRKLAIEST